MYVYGGQNYREKDRKKMRTNKVIAYTEGEV